MMMTMMMMMMMMLMPYDDDDDTDPDNLSHLMRLNGSISIDVVHVECPLQLLLWSARRRDVDGL